MRQVRWYRLSGQYFRFFKWKFCSVIVFVVAVIMLESICDSEACGKVGKQHHRFPGFPQAVISTACLTLGLCRQRFWRTVEVYLIGRERIQAGVRPGGVIEIDVDTYLRPNFLH